MKLKEMGLEKNNFVIRYAQRNDVPTLIKASDAGVSFIKPAYSKMASSPTKLGELLSMGIPVICNDIGDVEKIIVALSALEAILFLFLTLKILISVGPAKTWKTISNDPTIQFCLVFSIIFAFAVGISSYNFGSLSRYKIPCLPFYALGLILIYYKNKPLNKKLLGFIGL